MDKKKEFSKDEIYQMFVEEYIKRGYIYSGSIPANHYVFYDNKANFDKLLELQKDGKIERRNCEGFSFELSAQKRLQLILKHNLAVEWEKTGNVFYPNSQYGEVTSVYKETGTPLSIRPCYSISNKKGKPVM